MLSLQERIDVMVELGHYLHLKDERLQAYMKRTKFNNKWFTLDHQAFAIDVISNQFLDQKALEAWALQHSIQDNSMLKVGIIPADSTPLASFHDVLTTFINGHHSVVKLPETDMYLLPFLAKKLEEIEPKAAAYFSFPHRFPIKTLDAVMATGNDGLIKHFQYYFKDKPLLIRPIQQSVAIINGQETDDNFRNLSTDVLTYFGTSSRNVSKLLVPKDYDFNPLLEIFHEYNAIMRIDAYRNNYDYQISLLILNRILHWNNGSIILTENKELFSPISVLHYEYYSDEDDLNQKLAINPHQIETIISQQTGHTDFGKSLYPSLNDYLNGNRAMEFLKSL